MEIQNGNSDVKTRYDCTSRKNG